MISKKNDGISHYGHLTGAVCGAVFGFMSLNNEISEEITPIVGITKEPKEFLIASL